VFTANIIRKCVRILWSGFNVGQKVLTNMTDRETETDTHRHTQTHTDTKVDKTHAHTRVHE